MSALEVVELGPATTLQDGAGRRGYLRHGVPRSGPVDRVAHRLAARLAGRRTEEVATTTTLEVAVGTCVLRPVGATMDLAVTGSDAQAVLDGHRVAAPCVLRVPVGASLRVTATSWTYVVTAGDLEVTRELGSTSHHPRSGLGPTIDDGDRLEVGPPRDVRRGRWPTPDLGGGPLGLLAAPQTTWFEQRALRRLVTHGFTLTPATDRMGARLDGPALRSRRGHDVVSDGVVAGTLQVDGDGGTTVLLADHQSTGGYPKIAVLSTAGLARFVRSTPGTTVHFAWVDATTARADLRAVLTAVEEVVERSPTPSAAGLAMGDISGTQHRQGPLEGSVSGG